MFTKETLETLVNTIKWTSACGPVLISEMDTYHLRNARRSLISQSSEDNYCGFTKEQWLVMFEFELHRREAAEEAERKREATREWATNTHIEMLKAKEQAVKALVFLSYKAQEAYGAAEASDEHCSAPAYNYVSAAKRALDIIN